MARNEPKDKPKTNAEINSIKDTNALFNDILGKVNSILDVPDDNRELASLSDSVDEFVSKELQNIRSYAGEDISKFLYELINDDKKSNKANELSNLLEMDESSIKTFINENYKSKYLLFQDLKSVGERLVELDEAISTTRDAIISSDDMDSTISRTIEFTGNNDIGIDESLLTQIEDLEKKYKIDIKIQDHIIPKTLMYGVYYAYTIPYTKMIEDYINRINNHNPSNSTGKFTGITTESTHYNDIESTILKEHKDTFKTIASNIELSESPIPLPCLESGMDIDDFYRLILEANTASGTRISDDDFAKIVDDVSKTKNPTPKNKNGGGLFAELVKADKDFTLKDNTLSDIHIELIDPTRLIPIEIFKKCIGYYYIYEKGITLSSINNGKRGAFSNIPMNARYNNSNDRDDTIDKVVQLILRNTTRPMLEKNNEFKELFANALRQFDLKNRNVVIQYIPAEYVTEFKVNLDEHDNGQSILIKSLFYAKLYLSILIFKIIAILTRSNDMRVYYVKQSKAEKDITNKINEVIRSVKENQLDFLDFDTINSNSMLSKVGAARDMFVPMGSSGERGLEMDILSGQDIQLNTDLLEMLRTNMINGTGVPSVIMNYVNEADYSKTLVMANAKFLRRVISYQNNFNDSITDFYKKIIKFSSILPEDRDSLITSFSYRLMKPKSLNNTNMGDLINNTETIIAFMIKTILGENAEQSNDDNKIKDIITMKLAKERLPMLEWSKMEEYIQEAKLELVRLASIADVNAPPVEDSGY